LFASFWGLLFLIFEGPPRVYLLHRYGLKFLREITEEEADEYDNEEDYENLEHCHWAQENGENGANSCGWFGVVWVPLPKTQRDVWTKFGQRHPRFGFSQQ